MSLFGFLSAPLYWNAYCLVAVGFLIVPQMEPDTRVLGSKVKREDWTFEQDMVFEHAMAEFDETVSRHFFAAASSKVCTSYLLETGLSGRYGAYFALSAFVKASLGLHPTTQDCAHASRSNHLK